MAKVSEEKDGRLGDGMVVNKLGELYYFAYGSNMNREQIFARCAQPKVVAVAKLPHYQIAFYGYSKIWDGAVETVISAPDQEVWGVIYDLISSDRDRLDDLQDARLDGSGAYFHYPTRVTDKGGNIYDVLLYKKDNLGIPQKPSEEYLKFIVQGAADHDLPPGYVEILQRTESRKAEFNVPRQKPSGREFVSEKDCSQCGDVQDSVINISLGSRSHS